MKNAISVFSGGMDSLVASSYFMNDYNIHAITFDYAQKAVEKEIEVSKEICEELGFKHSVIKLDWLGDISNSSLTSNNEIPNLDEDKLMDKELVSESSQSVWVPGRNMVFTSIAVSFAESLNCDIIIVGWDKEEAETFPDNSKEFLDNFNQLINVGSPKNIEVKAPLIDLDKEGIVKLGLELNAPLELSYSCYKGEDYHCGVCESCVRRKRAFKLLDIEDPTIYEN